MRHQVVATLMAALLISAFAAAWSAPIAAKGPPSTSPEHPAVQKKLGPSSADVITFSEHARGTAIADQYKNRGILFRGDDPYIELDGSNPTSPVLSGTPRFYGAITGIFVVPGTTRRTTVDGFSLDVGYINDPGSTVVETYGVDGRKLGSVAANDIGMNRITVNKRGIRKFVVRSIDFEAAGFAIDNVRFDVGLRSNWVYLTRALQGVTATMTATRDGFGARYVVSLKDTKADGKCVKALVTLAINGVPDKNRLVSTSNCKGKRSVTKSGTIKPKFGTRVTGIKLRACVVRRLVNSCTGTASVKLPQLPSHGSDRQRTRAKELMFSTSLDAFLAAKEGPYSGIDSDFNWNADGCSVPFPSYNSIPLGLRLSIPRWVYNGVVKAVKENPVIGDTCERHDFGYRNLGLSDGAKLALKPTDFMRERVDEQWLADLRSKCKLDPVNCALPKGGAYALYRLLRFGGGPSFYGDN